jgi:phage baseplate assembly protein W
MAVVLRADKISPNSLKNKIYQDFFVSNFFSEDTKDLILLDNEDAVKQSVINILLTNTGERLFNPTIGSEINKLLFENVSNQTTSTLILLIKNAIENFEPRAKILDVVASPRPDENAYAVTIVFSTVNTTQPITLEFLLNRVR